MKRYNGEYKDDFLFDFEKVSSLEEFVERVGKFSDVFILLKFRKYLEPDPLMESNQKLNVLDAYTFIVYSPVHGIRYEEKVGDYTLGPSTSIEMEKSGFSVTMDLFKPFKELLKGTNLREEWIKFLTERNIGVFHDTGVAARVLDYYPPGYSFDGHIFHFGYSDNDSKTRHSYGEFKEHRLRKNTLDSL